MPTDRWKLSVEAVLTAASRANGMRAPASRRSCMNYENLKKALAIHQVVSKEVILGNIGGGMLVHPKELL